MEASMNKEKIKDRFTKAALAAIYSFVVTAPVATMYMAREYNRTHHITRPIISADALEIPCPPKPSLPAPRLQ